MLRVRGGRDNLQAENLLVDTELTPQSPIIGLRPRALWILERKARRAAQLDVARWRQGLAELLQLVT
jgi:hypothetical protein